jgi:hypothetical protein
MSRLKVSGMISASLGKMTIGCEITEIMLWPDSRTDYLVVELPWMKGFARLEFCHAGSIAGLGRMIKGFYDNREVISRFVSCPNRFEQDILSWTEMYIGRFYCEAKHPMQKGCYGAHIKNGQLHLTAKLYPDSPPIEIGSYIPENKS